jgi:hypothetical protein
MQVGVLPYHHLDIKNIWFSVHERILNNFIPEILSHFLYLLRLECGLCGPCMSCVSVV